MSRGKILFRIVTVLLLAASAGHARGQEQEKILMGAVILNGDTVPSKWLKTVEVVEKMPYYVRRYRAAMDKLRYNVYKVYPYALTAAEVLKDVDSDLAVLDSKDARKAYKKRKEDELNRRFKGELQNFTISQGQILVKLINRQTGRNCYDIIRELKGGFSAVVFQAIALVFENNLKRGYDPQGNDRDIELIVQEIEQNGGMRPVH